MDTESTTPLHVPKAAATYDHSTIDDTLRSQVNGILLRDGIVNKYTLSLLIFLLSLHQISQP